MEEKLRWTFSLYDINGDGFITQEEMIDIATAVYELMGRNPEIDTNGPDPDQIKEKVEKIFVVSFRVSFLWICILQILLKLNITNIKLIGNFWIRLNWQKMDLNQDGVVSLDEFIECCRNDETISRSMSMFDQSFWQDAKVPDDSSEELLINSNEKKANGNSSAPMTNQRQNTRHPTSSIHQFSKNVRNNRAINQHYSQQVSMIFFFFVELIESSSTFEILWNLKNNVNFVVVDILESALCWQSITSSSDTWARTGTCTKKTI